VTYKSSAGIVPIYDHTYIGPHGSNTTAHQAWVFHLPTDLRSTDTVVLNAPGRISNGSSAQTVTIEIFKVNDANFNVAVGDVTAFSTPWQASASAPYGASYPSGVQSFEFAADQAEYRTHASNGLAFVIKLASVGNGKSYSVYGSHMYLERKNA
jgi:hypothetical protein